jgi:hypothetical protein
MTKQSLTEEINNALEQVYRQWGVFTINNRMPENDELDMLKSKLMKLHDKINHLQLVGQPFNGTQINEPETIVHVETVVTENNTVSESALTPEPFAPAEAILEKDEIELPVANPEIIQTRKEVFKDSQNTVASLFHESETIHNKIGVAQPAFAIADQLKLTPVADLVKAIGINEKFLFISELFNHNSTQYHQVIDQLNKAPNFEEAYRYFNTEVASVNHVDASTEVYKQFVDLLQRRFL